MSDFSVESYYSQLETKRLGRPCIYLDKVESTIDVASNEAPNTIVLAKEQLKGRGQRNNVWLSPPGCAMGSVRLAISKLSPLAPRLCFIQHIMVIVAAKTLERISNKKLGRDLIKLKWPNDIIYTGNPNKPGLKIGGVLVHSRERNQELDVTLSFGLNVSNSIPTTCINDIIAPNNISIDSVVASMMNDLEKYTYEFNEEKFQELKLDYTERCLQMNQLIEDESNGQVRVKEVNDEGYLIGQRCSDHRLCRVTKIV